MLLVDVSTGGFATKSRAQACRSEGLAEATNKLLAGHLPARLAISGRRSSSEPIDRSASATASTSTLHGTRRPHIDANFQTVREIARPKVSRTSPATVSNSASAASASASSPSRDSSDDQVPIKLGEDDEEDGDLMSESGHEDSDLTTHLQKKPVRSSPPWSRPICQQIPPKPVLCPSSRIPSNFGSKELAQKELDTAFKYGLKGRYQACMSIITRFLSSLVSSVMEEILSDAIPSKSVARQNESDLDSYEKEEDEGDSEEDHGLKRKKKARISEQEDDEEGRGNADRGERCRHGTLQRCDRWRVHLLQLAAFCHVRIAQTANKSALDDLVPFRILHDAWTLRMTALSSSVSALSSSVSASEREALTNLCFETVDLAILNSLFSTAKHLLNTCAGGYGIVTPSLLMRRSWVNEQLKEYGSALSDAQMAATFAGNSNSDRHNEHELLGAEEPGLVIERLTHIFTLELKGEWQASRLNMAAAATPFISYGSGGSKGPREQPTDKSSRALGRGQRSSGGMGRKPLRGKPVTTAASKPKASKPISTSVKPKVGKTSAKATRHNKSEPTVSSNGVKEVADVAVISTEAESEVEAGSGGQQSLGTRPLVSESPAGGASTSASATEQKPPQTNKSKEAPVKDEHAPAPTPWYGQVPPRPLWGAAHAGFHSSSATGATAAGATGATGAGATGTTFPPPPPPKSMYVTQTWGYAGTPVSASASTAVTSKQTWPSSRPWPGLTSQPHWAAPPPPPHPHPRPPATAQPTQRPPLAKENTGEKSKRRKRSPHSNDESDQEGDEEDSVKKLVKKKKTKVGPPSIDLSQFGLSPGTTLPADAWKTEEVICQICGVAQVNTVFLPCAHRNACLKCTKTFLEANDLGVNDIGAALGSCLECKTPIERIVRMEAAIEHVMKAIGMKSLIHNREFYDAKNRLATYFWNEAHIADARDIKPSAIRKIAGIIWKDQWKTVPIPSGGSGKIRHKVVVSDTIPPRSDKSKTDNSSASIAGRLMPVVVAQALSGRTFPVDLGTFRSHPKITTATAAVSKPVNSVVAAPDTSNSALMPVFASAAWSSTH